MKNWHGQVLALQLGRWLGHIVSERIEANLLPAADWVVPVPSHWIRRIKRGFNVAELLAESICRKTGLAGPKSNILKSNFKTRKQGTLTMPQRFDNVKGCFSVSPKVNLDGATIMLVDDVMTSGATCIQAANVLKKAGARRVDVAIVARGVGRQD